jgi:hypothetical protein
MRQHVSRTSSAPPELRAEPPITAQDGAASTSSPFPHTIANIGGDAPIQRVELKLKVPHKAEEWTVDTRGLGKEHLAAWIDETQAEGNRDALESLIRALAAIAMPDQLEAYLLGRARVALAELNVAHGAALANIVVRITPLLNVAGLAAKYHVVDLEDAARAETLRRAEAMSLLNACLVLYDSAAAIVAALAPLDTLPKGTRIDAFMRLDEFMSARLHAIQIFHPTEYDQMSQRGPALVERLQNGLVMLRRLKANGAPAATIVSIVLAHDKSYLRSLNYEIEVVSEMERRNAGVGDISGLLLAQRALAWATIAPLVAKPPAELIEALSLEQLVPVAKLFEDNIIKTYADLKPYLPQIQTVYPEIPPAVLDKLTDG